MSFIIIKVGMLNFIQENFWILLMMFMGAITIIFSFSTYIKQQRLKNHGLMTEAKFVGFSKEKGIGNSSSIKVPVFSFSHKDKNVTNYHRIKGKTNSSGKVGETTPVYFNPDNPEKDYYLPEKDFLMKYILLLLGGFFFCLGTLYLLKDSSDFKNVYFLYLILSLFIGTIVLYFIGKWSNLKKAKKSDTEKRL